jgi:RNA recognition motif-containing protein
MRAQYFRGNVFVANLPPDFTDDRLAEAFDSYGIVLSAYIARDPATGKKLRYGFVNIATERAANLAISAMNGTVIDGCRLDVRMSEKTAKKAPPAGRAGRPAPQRPPQRPRAPLHLSAAPAASDADADIAASDNYTAVLRPRKTPTFQVERRSLPRRPQG